MIICLGLVIIPTSSSPTELLVYRVITAVGIACCTTMIASLSADYPQNVSRGKFIGTNGVFTAIGVIVLGGGLTQMPAVFSGMGYSTADAINYTLWIGGVLAFGTGLICFAGTRKGRAAEHGEKLPFLENARVGLSEIRHSPRLILACGATALSRGDLTVLASFMSLWITKFGTDIGYAAVDASATAGRLFGLTQIAMLLSLPLIAIMADRLDRVTNLTVAIGLAAIGYYALAFAPNPFESGLIYLVIVLAGIGEAVMIVSVPALIGQETPARLRGAIIGVAATFGALGIIATNKAAGFLFDNWSYQAPFMFMGILNTGMMIWALSVRFFAPAPVPAAAKTVT
jgi:MFS family permease